jgi:DNA topoisomerase-1
MTDLHAVLGSERDRELGVIDGAPVLVRRRLDSAFFQWGVKGNFAPGATKPLFGALLASMNPATVTVDDARMMLSLPRVVGVDPETGEEITASVGKHGGYVEAGGVRAKLDSPDDVFAVTVDDAMERVAVARDAKEKRSSTRGSRRRKD